MNALPGQLELATVVDHKKWTRPVHMVAAVIGGQQVVAEIPYYESHLITPTKIYEADDTHKPAGIRLAKMLAQYDDSPSSLLWSEIQNLAREILK